MLVLKRSNGILIHKKQGIKFMQLSETIKLYPTKYQSALMQATMKEYVSTVNSLVSYATSGKSISKITTADINVMLPSALTKDRKSVV